MRTSQRRLSVGLMALVATLAIYEFAFRFCTSRWGEVDIYTSPISLYYSIDGFFPGRPVEWLFAPRAQLPFGKVRLAPGTGAYVSGGEYFRRSKDGHWVNVTELVERRRSQVEGVPKESGSSEVSPPGERGVTYEK